MDTLTSLWNFFAEEILSLLPLSPFREYVEYVESWEYIGYLNWFFPFRACFVVLEAWLVTTGMYYMYSIAMRWIKMIE